uniref:Uncharacterized protein n=1 Tax=Leersia perrieri TaxID=77586 RepID=A0A0D9VEY2_9ORYZ
MRKFVKGFDNGRHGQRRRGGSGAGGVANRRDGVDGRLLRWRARRPLARARRTSATTRGLGENGGGGELAGTATVGV